MDICTIKNIIFDLLGNKKSHVWSENGNRYYHGQRVANLSLVLKRNIFPDDRGYDDILTVAAWFHDIMNMDGNHSIHAELGASKAREALSGFCSDEDLDKICDIIRIHDKVHDKAIKNDDGQHCLKLHQDADILDHYGTFNIRASFLIQVSQNKPMSDIIDVFRNICDDTDSVRKWLNYDLSKKVFDEKLLFLKGFTDRFIAENQGEIWDINNLL